MSELHVVFKVAGAEYVLPVLAGVAVALALFAVQKDLGPALLLCCVFLIMYALGRGRLLSDEPALARMRARLAADGYAFGSLVEEIVTGPQFLNKRRIDAQQQKGD